MQGALMVQEVLTMRYARKITLVFFICLLTVSAFAAPAERGLSARPKAPTGEAVKGDLWLVTIGINSYISWPRLKTAVNDAKTVKETLLKYYHLDPARVIELTEEKATRKNILGAFRDLAKKVKPDDSLLVYYAGHGHIDSITGKGSWIPVESGTDDPSAWISNRDITDYLNINAIKARHVLLISDSCFSGDFFRGSRAGLPTINDAFLKRAYTRSSRQAISSGGLEPVSDAGFGGNSVFSHFLITALANNRSPYLIPSEIFGEIKAGVGKNANQLPQFGDLSGTGGQDGGELILFLKGTADSRLQDLGTTSAARQKELEQLKKMEAEAAVAKQKEQQEIARKQIELDAVDKQIAEMKARLGTGSARSSDSLDAMLAMVEQKESQAQRLEELRRQREAEEQKRQQDIERLRQEAVQKSIEQLNADLNKFLKIASSKFGQDLKDGAWAALLAHYPAAKDVKRYDLDALVASQGFSLDNDKVVTQQEKLRRDNERRLSCGNVAKRLRISAPGNGKHNYTLLPIDTTCLKEGGMMTISIVLGQGNCAGSFDLFAEGGRIPKSGRVSSLASAYDVSPGTTRVIRYQFREPQIFQFGAEGNWFSDSGAENEVDISVSVVPLKK